MSRFFNPSGEEITYEMWEDAISHGEKGYTSIIDNMEDFPVFDDSDYDGEYEEMIFDGGADYGE